MKMMTRLILMLAAILFAPLARLQAQLPIGSHGLVGGAGMLGASIPPPGVYLRNATLFYTSSHTPGLPVKVDLFGYVQQARLFWITGHQILGANYGMDVSVPLAYIKAGTPFGGESQFNLADIAIEPLLLSWNFKQWDAVVGYSFFVPVGHFDNRTLLKQATSPGKGFWSHMLTFGGVWYPDVEKEWAMSLLNRYEFCHEQERTQITPGNMLTMEWGLSREMGRDTKLGFVGYYQQQVTDDTGPLAATTKSQVVGIGPEIRVAWPKARIITSLRYFYEVEARNRPQGSTITLTLGKRF